MISARLSALVLLGALGACRVRGHVIRYDVGTTYDYTYRAEVRANALAADGSESNGTNSLVTGKMVMRCEKFNGTYYELVMNLFDVKMDYETSGVASPGICTEPCPDDDAPVGGLCCGPTAFGYDVHFEQSVFGEVGEIFYRNDDSQYFVNVKLGAINALNTYASSTEPVAFSRMETDVIGRHHSNFTITPGGELSVQKEFGHSDVVEFVDATLRAHNVRMHSAGAVAIDTEAGRISHATVTHAAALVDVSASAPVASQGGRSLQFIPPTDAAEIGFDSQPHSSGSVTLAFSRSTAAAATPTAPLLGSRPAGLTRSSVMEAARLSVRASKKLPPPPPLQRVSAAPGEYPYNKSFATNRSFGGKVVKGAFAASVFGGTNWDCSQPTFNYDGEAHSSLDVTLFGVKMRAFQADAQYGRDKSAPLDDVVSVEVFGKPVLSKSLPQVDCSSHSSPIAHKAPGLDVKHTLWVGPIPVTFSASAKLDLDLTWGWQTCDSDLSASVWLKPRATLTVTGSASLDLLVITAATDLSVVVNTALQPSIFVRGTTCDLGFDVDLVRDPPDAAKLHSYYNRRKCKHLFFDCHLEEAGDKIWWSWNEPAETTTLAKKTFPIRRHSDLTFV